MNRPAILFRIAQGIALRTHPSYLVYFVTSRCDCRCAMCFNRENVIAAEGRRELSLDEVEKVSRSCRPLPQLLLSGGEPFLRTDIADIVERFYRYAGTRQVSIPTNGSATGNILAAVPRMLEQCPGLLLNVNLSLDGVGDLHDRLRASPGCFERLLRTYDGLAQVRRRYRRLTINVQTTIQPENADDIRSVTDYVKQRMDVNYHSLALERGRRSAQFGGRIERLERELEAWEAGRAGIRHLPVFERFGAAVNGLTRRILREMRSTGQRRFPCLAGRKLLVLSADGMLYPCEPLWLEPDSPTIRNAPDCLIADLREQDFDVRRALKTQRARTVRRYIDTEQCSCQYGCAVLNSVLYSPAMYPRFLAELAGQGRRAGGKHTRSHA